MMYSVRVPGTTGASAATMIQSVKGGFDREEECDRFIARETR